MQLLQRTLKWMRFNKRPMLIYMAVLVGYLLIPSFVARVGKMVEFVHSHGSLG